MNDAEIVKALTEFSTKFTAEVKGLSAKIVWNLYGLEANWSRGGEKGTDWDAGLQTTSKENVDWETYILANGAGGFQTHLSGKPEIGPGGGFTGKPEEVKGIGFIHQLLPTNLANLKNKCKYTYKSLGDRSALLSAEPIRASAMFFSDLYLQSVYRGVAGSDQEILLKHLKDLPGKYDPSQLLAAWKQLGPVIKTEQPSSSYEVSDGRFKIYRKEGKNKILVNGWLFGEGDEDGGGGGEDIPGASDYGKGLEDRGFHSRMTALCNEGAFLLGKEGGELVALALAHQNGTLAKLLQGVAQFTELAEDNMLQPAHADAAKALLKQLEKFAAAAKINTKLMSSLGLDPDTIRAQTINAQKIKRKLHLN